ncbi:AGE family epimerase/isomerase [Acidipropionibacterium virtanenii]|uniref:Sulfoquinovose isomerase n=1 Tax=Acidipropionibacterium virtanenii TaxID=2057246 RepID=A0A344UQZ2_9ACTN|nr:AGE family epimerase/isomerase [Acidipropionibacterium virtanenii]AXE37690.1 Sulfoquinovose isomerase [Acidipropionibacterium virtanenii]
MTNWIGMPAHNRWMENELDRILEFGRGAKVPNGFGWLSNTGGIREEQGTQLWITARMVHTYSIASLMGRPGARTMAAHGVKALTEGPLRDREHGGWYAVVANEGDEVTDRKKEAYAHAFAALGAASAVAAGVPGSEELLTLAVDCINQHFWSDEEQMVVDNWDETFAHCDEYRGGNANMHSVEAFLVLHDVTGDDIWLDRALRIASVLIHDVARNNAYRVNEHFDDQWNVLRDYNKEAPGDRFRAFGGTPGHWVEWGRLLVQMRATLAAEGKKVPEWMLPDAEALFHQGVADAWATDGAPGFVYTVDWEGEPVIRSRVRWVIVEAIGSAYALHSATGKSEYADYYQEFWDYCRDYLLDYETGSWWQELDETNTPTTKVWNGKQDIYHLLHCLIVPRLPLTPGMAPALARGLLDRN